MRREPGEVEPQMTTVPRDHLLTVYNIPVFFAGIMTLRTYDDRKAAAAIEKAPVRLYFTMASSETTRILLGGFHWPTLI
jgi:hypothetical protein